MPRSARIYIIKQLNKINLVFVIGAISPLRVLLPVNIHIILKMYNLKTAPNKADTRKRREREALKSDTKYKDKWWMEVQVTARLFILQLSTH